MTALAPPNPNNAKPTTRRRDEIAPSYRWDLAHIFPNWESWEEGCQEIERNVAAYTGLKGTLAKGPELLLKALKLDDDLGRLFYRVWFYPALMFDEDQRRNDINAKRQQVQALSAKVREASSWFHPELLNIPLSTVRQWMEGSAELADYRFALENLYRQQEHVLDEAGERLLALSSRLNSAPGDAYSALSTADMRFPTVTLSSGELLTVSPGQYRAALATRRQQQDRALVFEAFYACYQANINTFATLYQAVAERDWFLARSRNYPTTLEAALHGDNIPTSVVTTLIDETRKSAEPLRRYHRLRRRALAVERYHLYDAYVSLIDDERPYYYPEAQPLLIDSVAPLGPDYQEDLRRGLESGWIDVYESEGKRSGAYSAGVYGVHPYMLLNYNDTLDDLFTLAHEMGHSMHTLLSHRHQPFHYASYTIFVAEVASTLNEALLLEYLLERTSDPRQRISLLQHAIDSIAGTYFTQVLFADWELRAHGLVEAGQPMTSDVLSDLYREILGDYYGDAVEVDNRHAITWARIPHFFRSPYYVYQYATCFASAAQILQGIRSDPDRAVPRYLDLLKSGGNDYPMNQLQRAGVDLREPHTIQAVVQRFDELVARLEEALRETAGAPPLFSQK